MGGKKKKNCSACKGRHKGPWGHNKCKYFLSGTEPGDSISNVTPPSTPPKSPASSVHSSSGARGDPRGARGDPGMGEPLDPATYILELESRIAYLMECQKRQKEMRRIAVLEDRLRELEEGLSGNPCPPIIQRGGVSAPVGISRSGVPSQLIHVNKPHGPTSAAAQTPFATQDMPDDRFHGKRSSKYCPEYYLDTAKTADKLTYREFLYGALCVADTLGQEGRQVSGYINHLRFIAWKAAMGGAYQTQALVRYDQHVTSKVLRGSLPDWPFGDDEGCCLHLGVEALWHSSS